MHAPDGRPTNAVYGVLTMLMKLIQTQKPSHIILARDSKGKSFRNDLYPEYKANRGEAPEELVPQFSMIEELIQKMEIPERAMPNYEADDVIGSLVVQHQDEFDEVYIASGDKDLMQFVNDKVKMLDTMKGKLYGPKEVFEKMGVHPDQIMDYLSLVGDSSDNIPGVKGIGAKGAASLLAEYKTLDNIIKNKEEVKPKRANTALMNHEEDAILSRELVKIVTDLKLEFNHDDFKFELKASNDLLDYLESLNFKSIRNKLAEGSTDTNYSRPQSFVDYKSIKKQHDFDALIESLKKEDQVFVEPFYTHDNYHKTDATHVTVATGDIVNVIYCDEFSNYTNVAKDLISLDGVLLASTNLKSLSCVAICEKLEIKNGFDLQQAYFVLNPDAKHDLVTISKEFLDENVLALSDLRKETLEQETSIRNFEYGLAKRAYAGIRVYPWLEKRLKEHDLWKVYEELDMPLIPILSSMEMLGIHLNSKFYAELETEFSAQTEEIEKKITEIAGGDINLKSPKQVGELLFEKMGLPVIKKTKTGYSTNVQVLEELVAMGHEEVPGLILKYREVDKLLSTYVRALPKLVDEDGKIHTHFMQNVASTGRLSSEHPNLQNIPIRTDNGRKLRKGFVASSGTTLVGADYSQVELRILAHLSGDEVMIKAFENDEDIHAQTAAEVFGVALEDVSSEERSHAKAINFGLMYGQSSFGLSQTLGISRKDAKDYITRYFERFHKVKSFLDGLKEKCEETGYSETMNGRKRYIPDINSTNRTMKSVAERMAINSPIQGTAADIIKLAMIRSQSALKEKGLKSKLLLQVHDELIFEVPKEEVDEMKTLIRNSMENACKLNVPLKVDMGVGENWYDLK